MMQQEIELADVKKLTDSIKIKYDYDFTNYALSSFKRRLQRVLEVYKFTTIDELVKKVCDDAAFFKAFLCEITVNVTEMFRDPSLWRELRDHIIPNIMLNNEVINIWHAGCSSGEEVYSMAILLKEMNLLHKAKIVATDIDTNILDKARHAGYSIKNMDLNQKNYIRYQEGSSQINNLNQYYKEENGKAVMDTNLVANVTYKEHNLVSGMAFGKFDLILCRNVMIYFNQTLQNAVLKLFHESLNKYSYLIVGSKESLIWCEIAHKFIVVNTEEKIYKKIKD